MARSRTTHPGRALTEKQDQLVRLIAHGLSNSEACRLVGINRKTGTRWRLGRTVRNTAGEAVHYPSVRIAAAPRARHPRYLSLEGRTVIADLRRERKTVREIADANGRSPTTVSRELRRNADHSGRYLPPTADRLAAERVPRPRKRRLLVDDELRTIVDELFAKRWSPEQVAQIHVPTGRPTAEAMRTGISREFGRLPADLRRSLTWNQGKELALHQKITEQIGTKVFFGEAHSPGSAAATKT